MKKREFLAKVLAMLILTSACISGCAANERKLAETDKDGFVSIFDGKTLKGWQALPAETAPAWTVKDGMIVGDGDKGMIQLQLHDPGMIVYFKDVRLKILEPGFTK